MASTAAINPDASPAIHQIRRKAGRIAKNLNLLDRDDADHCPFRVFDRDKAGLGDAAELRRL
jgi:hypothetical protein